MSKCSKCKRTIPADLLAPVFTNEGVSHNVCGLCALEISNEILGIDRLGFEGEQAQQMLEAAAEHYEKTNQ
jgi:hypothetical protein